MKTDNEIQQDVLSQIKWDPFLQASEIGVAVKNGVVTLSGHVDSYLKKVEAEKAVKKVAGVRAVVLDVHVGISEGHERTDTEIAEAILDALRWHTSIREENITVRVENGNVTLTGEVEWDYQRTSAKNIVANLSGVANVINLVRVRPTAIAEDIKQKISNAFQRVATLDADRISVEVKGDEVVLSGIVNSYVEREDAESAAWSAPGITKVQNLLYIATEEEYSF
jgi:osmotically-inducible protein OsmY